MVNSYRVLTFCLLFGLSGCPENGGSDDDSPAATADGGAGSGGEMAMDAEVSAGTLVAEPPTFRLPAITPGRSVDRQIILTNPGDTMVTVTEVTLDAPEGNGLQIYYGPADTSFTSVGIDSNGMSLFQYPVTVDAGDAMQLVVQYRGSDAPVPTGSLTVTGDFEGSPLALPIEAVASAGTVSASEMRLDFGRVPAETSGDRTLTVTNVGASPLTLVRMRIENSLDFTARLGAEDPIADSAVIADPDGDGEPGLSPQASFDITLTYTPRIEGPASGDLFIESDDPATPVLRIPMIANNEIGCLAVTPANLEWEGMVGENTRGIIEVANCGDSDLVVDEIRLLPGSADQLTLDELQLPDRPLTIPAGADPLEVNVLFSPVEMRHHRGNVRIRANDPNNAEVVVPIRAISGDAPDMPPDDN